MKDSSISRRQFIKSSSTVGVLGALGASPLGAIAKTGETKITILHTNDWHSRIEPFPLDGGSLQGLGGAAARAGLIQKIRNEESHVLLLDAGDIFQGTPYFNYYGGELEYKLMSQMKYDCVTLGNHDFDNGIEGLIKQMPHAGFSFVNCNYDMSKTALKEFIQPYKIYTKGPVRIGVFGIGIELKGLVPDKLCEGIVYMDPIVHANAMAEELKTKHHCDLIICLSHLGYEYKNEKVSDLVFASKSKNIDLIIGGHTHTFLPKAVVKKNAEDKDVTINQVGWAGVNLGRVDYTLNPFTGNSLAHHKASLEIGF